LIFDQFPNERPLYNKVKATEILVTLNNLTTVDFLFEYINHNPLENSEEFIHLLKEIAIKIPQHAQTVKSLLLNIKDNSDDSTLRKLSLEYLIIIWGENNLHDEIISTIINDSEPDVRLIALEYYNFLDRKDLLMQRIQNDLDWYVRIKCVENFLSDNTDPWDLKFIVDYLINENDPNAIRNIENQINLYIPPFPSDPISAVEMTDKILLYTDSLYSYGWITNQTAYNSYKNQLFNIKKYLLRGLHNDALAAISSILNAIEPIYDPPNLTDEGYTFLHYPLNYLQGMIH
jgi:hypothetical protein